MAMDKIMEGWRKLLEGEVVDLFPGVPPIEHEENTQRVIVLEDTIAKLLEDLYGNQSEIPIDVLVQMEGLVNAVGRTLPK